MRDKLTDEESAREHLADSLRGTARRVSRQNERQLPVWRTLRDSETDTKRNWMVFARAPETRSAGQLESSGRSFRAMDAWTKQVLTLHTNRSTPGSIELGWSGSEKHETMRIATTSHSEAFKKKRRPKDRSVSQKNRRRQAVCHCCRWSGMPTGKLGLKAQDQDKLWESMEFRKQEAALALSRVGTLRRAAAAW